ncbi:XRE family transcriptional regulator [Geoanaerobacter pelophilus]|uniref:XRE family transcriptional regulator n=2 Tax=Geoanaerobacter pelophilus TaxID=60036 RepID=A0ABQ0MKA6_9BACT|nr:XRE family transcriptional regulator [Geoanaerobacter pelophilus]
MIYSDLEMAFCFVYSTNMLFELGAEIRKFRKLRKITQQQIADELGMSRATISQLESGTVQEIGIRKVIRILDYLGLELRVSQAGIPPTLEELREDL